MSISLDENKKGLGLLGSFCRREFPLHLRLPPADFLFWKFVQFVLLYFCTSEVLLYFSWLRTHSAFGALPDDGIRSSVGCVAPGDVRDFSGFRPAAKLGHI